MSDTEVHICAELLTGAYTSSGDRVCVMLVMRCGCGHEIRMGLTAEQARTQAGALIELANKIDGGRGVQ